MTEFDNIIKHMVKQRAILRSTIKKSLVDLFKHKLCKAPNPINSFYIATNPIDLKVEYWITSGNAELSGSLGSLGFGVHNRDETNEDEEEFWEYLQSIKFDELLSGVGLCAINLGESIELEWKSDDRI